jgi:HK97 family phage prohead protease
MSSDLQFGKGSDLWDYWVHGKGTVRWMKAADPWTTLRNLLIKEGVPAREAPGLATNIMQATPAGRALFKAHHGGRSKDENMTEILTRSFEGQDLEIRSGGDGRTISGIAVPYNVEQRINANLIEVFRPGAFDAQLNAAHRVKFSREHMQLGGVLIGKATDLREDANGLYAEFRVSQTPAGDETLELIRDGVLTDLSIGFMAGQNSRSKSGVTERLSARLFEVSVVLEGAYGEAAAIQAVRAVNEETNRLSESRALVAKTFRPLPLPGSMR